MVRDVACGKELRPEEAAAKQNYRGMTYYFCSEACRQRFMQNPEAVRKEEVQIETEGRTKSL